MLFENLVVLGSGLIGGSLAWAVKANGIAASVSLVNRRSETNDIALDKGIADHACTYDQLADRVSRLRRSDLVVVAVPVGSYGDIFSVLANTLPEGVVLTDVGSTKARVVELAEHYWSRDPVPFVPGHPIAGSEKTGIESASSTLFEGRRVILTPLACNAAKDIQLVSKLWQAVGSQVDLMDTEHHDEVLAATSHLPHLLAYGLVDSLAALDATTEIFRYAGGGFRDFTRIAESDPLMWRDIFLANQPALLRQLDNFESHLLQLRELIRQGSGEQIEDILRRSQAARRRYRDIDQTAPDTLSTKAVTPQM